MLKGITGKIMTSTATDAASSVEKQALRIDMPFVKLDTGIIRSTLWMDKPASDVFIAALLMAEPREFLEPQAQIQVDSLDLTGWAAPPGWYGFVPAAGIGILSVARIEREPGMDALRRLGEPDPESRSKEYGGRRMIRVDGGYLILNYIRYRERDYTAAERSKRWRERKKRERHGVTPPTTHRNVTQAEAEAEAENERKTEEPAPLPPDERAERRIRESKVGDERRLLALVSEMESEDPNGRDAAELMRLVTSYDKPDGRRIGGCVNPATLSYERVRKSIEDAEAVLSEWRQAKNVAQ